MKLVFVTGMHRSGTSYISGELAGAGLTAPANLLDADPDNPLGYFESREIIDLNDRMLGFLGSNWMDPAPFPDDWQARLVGAGYDTWTCDLIEQLLNLEGIVVLKDPRFSRTLPFWRSMMRTVDESIEFCVVHVYRYSLSVAKSLLARNNIPLGHSFQLWARYNIDALTCISDLKHIVVQYEAVMRNPSQLRDPLLEMVADIPSPDRIGSFAEKSLDRSGQSHDVPESFKLPLLGHTGGLSLHNLRALYRAAGDDSAAEERRHYATIHSTLWTVLREMDDLRTEISALRDQNS